MSEAAAPEKEKKPPRQYPVVLVRVEGFPLVDPGRRLIYDIRPSQSKARKMAARLSETMPEHEWSWEMMTHSQITATKRAPFALKDIGVEVRPPARVR